MKICNIISIISLILFVSIFIYIAIFCINKYLFKIDTWEEINLDTNINTFENIPIFILNLEKNKDRKNHITKLLTSLKCTNFQFITPVSIEEALNNPLFNRKNGPEASHCLTMYNILKYSIKNKFNEFIILEDDIDIFSNNMNKIQKIIKTAEEYDYDLLFLEYCNDICNKQKKITNELYKLYRPWCAAAIYYNLKGAKKILNNIDFLMNNNVGYDSLTANLCKSNKINCFGSKIFKQNPNFNSDLTNSTRAKYKNHEDVYCY